MNDAIKAQSAARPVEARRSRLGTWLDHHAYSVVASFGRMLRQPWATALTVGVMAVALVLPLGLWATMQNLSRFAGDVQQSRQVSVFLKPEIDLARARALAQRLREREDVADVLVRTPEDGLAQLRQAGLGEAIAALEANPLPSLLIVTPRGDELRLVDAIDGMAEADLVQHDAGWRERLAHWLRLGTRTAWVLAVLLGLGALLVVGNTVRLDIQSRHEEIGVLQLLGASDGFIRRPFLYLGIAYGVASGVIALGLLTLADLALRAPLHELARSYGSGFALQGFDPVQAAGVVLGSAVLGWLGAGFVTGHYLRQSRATESRRKG